jgi:hypothetical protein
MEYFGPPEEFLETAVREMMVSLTDSQLLSAQFITFKNYPAVEYQVEIKRHFKVDGIVVLVSNTIYKSFGCLGASLFVVFAASVLREY